MNKICLFAVAFSIVVSFTRARECYYLINNMNCPYECCGEEGSMKCMDSCDGVDCSSDEDCGDNACCSNGKCNDDKTDCDSSRYLRCSGDCPVGCCAFEYGVCQTGVACFPQNANCTLNEDCASSCCHKGLCESYDDVCDSNGEQPVSGHSDPSYDHSSTTNIDWKLPVIVIAVIIGVALKITIFVVWMTRRSRSRVVVVRTVMAPTSTVELNHRDDCDTVPFLSQDEEQIKHMQALSHREANAQ